ncbi:ion transporter [Aquirhabdus parva]|uniref:Ion transporter n=1 Tax=Aquirhabdus parva TaxID=2283318 RepID=A0A345P697_9GAMM|nr:ion transporter [Aquirhabdus parva]AXI02806.1 ion transporter [Aquirhabdus parva]
MIETQSTEPKAPLINGRAIDWILFLLAMISLGLLIWQNFAHVSQFELMIIRLTDYSVCSIFAAEFFWRWLKDGWTLKYLGRNWYAILGMIPISNSIMHPYPWLRALLILARFGRAIDRILGEGFTYRLVNRLKNTVVNAISGLVTIAVLDRVADVLVKGTYTDNIARALAEDEGLLRAMVLEKLKSDPQTGRLSWLPYHDEIVESVINAVLRVTESILKDSRTDALVSNMLRVNVEQLRAAIDAQEQEKESD